jgi:hypothetical protein
MRYMEQVDLGLRSRGTRIRITVKIPVILSTVLHFVSQFLLTNAAIDKTVSFQTLSTLLFIRHPNMQLNMF